MYESVCFFSTLTTECVVNFLDFYHPCSKKCHFSVVLISISFTIVKLSFFFYVTWSFAFLFLSFFLSFYSWSLKAVCIPARLALVCDMCGKYFLPVCNYSFDFAYNAFFFPWKYLNFLYSQKFKPIYWLLLGLQQKS